MNSSTRLSGLAAALIACLFSSLMGAAFFKAHLEDPQFSSFSGSFVRVIANILLVLLIIAGGRSGTKPLLPPKKHPSLWAWGVFGALTVTTYFAAIHLIGSGMTAFLGASSGIFIALLSAPLTRQRTPRIMWLAIAGSVLGLYLLSRSTGFINSWLGSGLAVSSGFFGAVAYLMIARTRSTYSVSTIMMTWCVSALIAHLIVFCFIPIAFPSNIKSWCFILFAAIAASFAQQFTAYAFQRSSPSFVASLSYLTPVVSLGIDIYAFGFTPTPQAGIGAALIVSFGALIPLLQRT